MTHKCLYLIGAPGAGKTTLLNAALAGVTSQQHQHPFAHITYPDGAVQLGAARGLWSGTDALALNVQPLVEDWLARLLPQTVIAEGDRLANDRFFRRLCWLGYELTVVWLATPDDIAAQRRAARGSRQNPAWIKGRTTKVRRLGMQWTPAAWQLDGSRPLAELAARLQTHPVITTITNPAVVT